MISLEKAREFWKCAGTFPANKEEVYPDHAAAHGLDDFPPGRRVLEYGCGGGSDAISWARRGHEVFFADIVGENLMITFQRLKDAGLTERCTACQLVTSDRIPVLDESIDVVTSNGVLHHIEDPKPVLHAMRRAIKPSGKLLVMLYSPALRESFEATIRDLVGKHHVTEGEAFGWCTDGKGCYARSYSTEQARELLAETGFRLLETRSSQEGRFLHHHAVPA